MSREDILAKSRAENKDKDLYEKEVSITAGNIGAITAAILATIFFVVQVVVGNGINLGLYAIVFSVPAAGYIVKSIRIKRSRYIVLAVITSIAALLFSFAHIYTMISTSVIL